jgi:hypothetical protein
MVGIGDPEFLTLIGKVLGKSICAEGNSQQDQKELISHVIESSKGSVTVLDKNWFIPGAILN